MMDDTYFDDSWYWIDEFSGGGGGTDPDYRDTAQDGTGMTFSADTWGFDLPAFSSSMDLTMQPGGYALTGDPFDWGMGFPISSSTPAQTGEAWDFIIDPSAVELNPEGYSDYASLFGIGAEIPGLLGAPPDLGTPSIDLNPVGYSDLAGTFGIGVTMPGPEAIAWPEVPVFDPVSPLKQQQPKKPATQTKPSGGSSGGLSGLGSGMGIGSAPKQQQQTTPQSQYAAQQTASRTAGGFGIMAYVALAVVAYLVIRT